MTDVPTMLPIGRSRTRSGCLGRSATFWGATWHAEHDLDTVMIDLDSPDQSADDIAAAVPVQLVNSRPHSRDELLQAPDSQHKVSLVFERLGERAPFALQPLLSSCLPQSVPNGTQLPLGAAVLLPFTHIHPAHPRVACPGSGSLLRTRSPFDQIPVVGGALPAMVYTRPSLSEVLPALGI